MKMRVANNTIDYSTLYGNMKRRFVDMESVNFFKDNTVQHCRDNTVVRYLQWNELHLYYFLLN